MSKKTKKQEIDTEILVGYINEFEFLDSNTASFFQGHPEKGRIYQIIKDSKYGYRLHIGAERTKDNLMEGILLGKELSGNYEDRWKFDVQIITKENFIDFDITSDDTDKLREWFETGNSALLKVLEKPVRVTAQDSSGSLVDVTPMIDPDSVSSTKEDMFSDALNKIAEREPSAFDSIMDLVIYLGSTYGDKYEAAAKPNIAKEFILTASTPEVAAFNSIKYLQRYCTKGFNKSYNKQDVLKAIHYCIFELQRRKFAND